MGACMSTNSEQEEQKKQSQAIDKILEEDSRRLRRECKILLLGGLRNNQMADLRTDDEKDPGRAGSRRSSSR